MLRQAYIANAVISLLIYAAVWSVVPSISGGLANAGFAVQSYAQNNCFWGPLMYRVILARFE